MELFLKDHVVMVTGAGRGIGRAIAEQAGRAGGHVILVSRTADELEEVASVIDRGEGRATVTVADLTDFERASEVVTDTLDTAGRLDVLVNNAGTNHIAPLALSKEADWRRVYELNVFAVFNLTKLALRHMISEKRGRVINIASVAAKVGARFNSAYASSKAAVLGFTKSVALETAKQGITVNAVCPWHVDTELVRESMERRGRMFGADAEAYLEEIVEGSAMGRLLEPEEVAALVIFLMTPEASGITGQTFNVCGGNDTS